MSQCKQNAEEFIQNTFSPHIAVLCSSDAELLCQKNNLSFVQLVQPFCRLSSEVHIRDANNVTHSIHNLRISVCDMAAQPPPQNVIKKQLSDAVSLGNQQSQEYGSSTMISIGNYDLEFNASTPWFESWREAFLQVLPPSDHEYLNHCLACIFVVASTNSDPLSTFTSLANQQVTQQQQFPNKLPRWFCQGILHYYVLLHDVVDSEQSRAEALYQSMKATFGVQICHLLQVNSRSHNTVESMKSGGSMQPDPWSQFLTKPGHTDTQESDLTPPEELNTFPSKSSRTSQENINSIAENSTYKNFELALTDSTNSFHDPLHGPLSHPLASPNSPPPRNTPSPDSDPTAAASGYPGENHHKPSRRTQDKSQTKAHGMCLTPSDLDRLRIFMHEFVVRALIPWAERQMKMLSEQLTSRKGLHKSFFSATKKWFGSKPAGPLPSSQNTTVVYTKDAPELQLRRLGDLAFLFQMYDFAYNTYHTAKKDFNNDQAWLHFAGALEMSSLSLFLQGPLSQKPYHHYMETAISTYLTSCRNSQYATRATLTSAEALKKRGMFTEAAMQYLKMTSEDTDLTSALFLEQAAHCFIALKAPMVRKYAFHMILAGHRFNKGGQRKHSLRCYNQALQVYKAKHWSIAEDHIHFTIGRQSFNLKQLENATVAFKHLLTDESKQPTSQQAAFLREFLFVFKQLLSQDDSSTYGHLPELPLPIVESNTAKVLLSSRERNPTEPLDKRVPASGLWFSDDLDTSNKWAVLEGKLLQSAGKSFKPNAQLFTNKTDNKSSPIAFVGEPIRFAFEVENPLHVMLVLSDVSLLWTFLPSIQGTEPPQLISNEATTGVKNSLADEIVQTSVIKELIVQGIQSEHLELTLTPRQPGQLRVVGLAYNLGTSSIVQNSPLQQDNLANSAASGSSHSKPSYTSSVCVRGKQKLEPRGPRLNAKKEERTQKAYGPDRRLDLIVHEEMPNLQIIFCEFPENVLCGEVQCMQIEFTNTGKNPLKSLKVTSSHPKFFTFGSTQNLPKYPYVYLMRGSDPNSTMSTGSRTTSVSKGSGFLQLPDVLDIPIGKSELLPGETVSLPMWIRGDDIGGLHEVDFLFYYEPVQHSSSIKHRVVRHRALVNTVESLRVHASVSRPAAHLGVDPPLDLNSCILACELENLSQVQVQRPHVQELQVTQVSCVSPSWTLSSLGTRLSSGVRLGSRENLQLVMKGLKKFSEIGDDVIQFSEIAFDREEINSYDSPCADFFVRSLLHNRSLSIEKPHIDSLESAVYLNLTLVFLWKAYVVQESGQMRIVVGQHHVHIEKLNSVVTSCVQPAPTRVAKPTVSFSKSTDETEKVAPTLEVTTRLVTYSFSHCHTREHRFSTGVCVIPVKLSLQNHSEVNVNVMVDTTKSPDSLGAWQDGAHLSTNSSTTPSPIRWVGFTQASITLAKGECQELCLKVLVSYPGTYNLNCLSVFVNYSDDQSQMILQKHSTPSILTLVDTSS